MFNAGYWWEAHVFWERLWAESPAPDARELLQGLIQLSAALVKRRAENPRGETKLLAKATGKLRAVRERVGADFMGVRLDALIEQADQGVDPVIELHV